VVTLNPEMVMLAERSSEFRSAVDAAAARVPDGAGIIWARWYLRSAYWQLLPSLVAFMRQPVERVTGVEAVTSLAKLCAERGELVFLLGGTRQQTQITGQKLQQKFSRLKIAQAADHKMTLGGPAEVVAEINRLKPAVLLVAYGAPGQTLWIEAMRTKLLGVKIAIGVGGAFAIISEDLPRAPLTLRKLNLEWLWRLYLEPSRLPRIWQATVKFPGLVRRQKRLMHRAG